MRCLVIGGAGRVGRQVMASLAAAGVEAVVASRVPGPGGLALDLRDGGAVRQAAAGFDAAFLTTPLGPDEAEVGVAAVEAIYGAGVRKLVYVGIMNLEAMRQIPHFEAKIPVRAAVLAHTGGVVVAPNFFFQNDAMIAPAIAHAGVYPLPVGEVGVWSVDVADIGRACARAMLENRWDGAEVPLCGTECLTGPGMAAVWSAALGRDVTYGGNAIAPFLAILSRQIPDWSPWIEHDFRMMLEVTQAMGCAASQADIAATEAILCGPPRSYRSFVAELAAGFAAQPEGAR